MEKNKKNAPKIAMTLGIIGVIAGIFLIISKAYFIGISGSVASAGLAIKGYNDLKSEKG